MKHNFHDDPDSFISNMFLSAVSDTVKGHAEFVELQEASDNGQNIEFTMQINGREVDPKAMFESLERNYKWAKERAVKDAVDSLGFEDIYEVLRAVERAVKREARQRVQKAGYTYDYEGY